jgi:hypothetical protein
MTAPRFVVELRPPRKGERFISVNYDLDGIIGAPYDNCCANEPRWVIVDPVPADPAPKPQ